MPAPAAPIKQWPAPAAPIKQWPVPTAPAGSSGTTALWQAVDEAFGGLLADEADRNRWLLIQTLATGTLRRALYGALGVQAGWRLLDVGTGFGPMAVELAASAGCRAIGVDVDLDVLARAGQVVNRLRHRPGPGSPAGSVTFTGGDCTKLPFADGVFDAVVTRFVLQHLPDPAAAVSEMVRVVRPDGLVCVVDADDGMSVVYPPPSEPIRLLQEAFVALQYRRGGDRTIGRKVAGLLDTAGVGVSAVLVMPQAAYGPSSPTDINRRLLLERFTAAAGDMVATGLLGEDDVAAGLHAFGTEMVGPTTTIEGHLAVVGRRRPR